MNETTDIATKPSRHVELTQAMFLQSMPCNPLPFLHGMIEHIREHGTASVRSDEVKSMLWIVNHLAYPSGIKIDFYEEYERLKKSLNP